MDIIDDMINDGRDVGQFVTELTVHLRNLLITLTVKEADAILDMAEENIDRLTAQAKAMSAEELIFLIKTFSRLSGEMKYANNQRILLEVELIKLCSPSEKTDFDAVIARLAGLERQVKNGVAVQNISTSPQAEVKKAPPKKQRPKALPEDVTAAIDIWSDLVSEFEPILQGLMSAAKPGYMEDGRLTIVCDNLAVEGLLKDKIPGIKEAFDTRLKKEFDIRTIVKAEFEAWERVTYGENEPENDPEFESLMGGYFPEADFE
jgi:DNA polymerase-3 subunit gamma/tau